MGYIQPMSRLVISLVVSILGLLFTAVGPAIAHASPMRAEHAMFMHNAHMALPCHEGMQPAYQPDQGNTLPAGVSALPHPAMAIPLIFGPNRAETCLHAAHSVHEHAMPCCTESGQSFVATINAGQPAALLLLSAVIIQPHRINALPAGPDVAPLLPPPRPSNA